MEWLLSIDIGTTALKMALVDSKGRILRTVSHSYPLRAEGNRIEQDPRLWWDAVMKGSMDLAPLLSERKPAAIILSGQMQDLIPIVAGEDPATAILYSDTRARAEHECFARDLGLETLVERSGNLPSPAGLPAKLLWLREHERATFDTCDMLLLGAPDFIYWKMTGSYQTDLTTASSTGLLHFDSNQWDRQVLDYLGVSESRLPALAPAAHSGGRLTKEAARLLGLPVGLPVFHGAGDAAASTVGSGSGVPGRRSCYLGTSGWIAAGGSTKRADPSRGIFNLRHPDPTKIIQIGPLLTAAGNLEWLVSLFYGNPDGGTPPEVWDRLTAEAARVQPGSDGLLYLPHLAGERSPFLDPDARGVFIGLRRDTGQGQMFRAVMEGVALSLAMIDELMPDGSQTDRILQCSGGGAKNQLWLRIIGACLKSAVRFSPNPSDSGILGNYLIAGRQLGWCADYSLPVAVQQEEREIPIDGDWAHRYRDLFALYRTCYPRLKGLFGELGKFASYGAVVD